MQFGKDKVLRLMIVDDSVEAAEAIVSGLRNSGVAVRPSRPESEEELATLLGNQPPDLVMAAHDAGAVSLEQVMQRIDASGKDLPLLVLFDSIDDARMLQVTELGARGIALRGRTQHIQRQVLSEWSDLEARRALRRLE